MVNRVILLGNITEELKLSNKLNLAKTSLAINKKIKKSNGEKVNKTVFIDIEFWGKLADSANKFLKKGDKVIVEGELDQSSWVNQEGKKRKKHKIRVTKFHKIKNNKGDNNETTN